MFDIDANQFFNDKVNHWCDKNDYCWALNKYRAIQWERMDAWQDLIYKVLMPPRIFSPEQFNPSTLTIPQLTVRLV